MPDRKITFRVVAPKAQTVHLESGDLPAVGFGIEMEKGEEGVWQATLGPVEPGAYRYLFNIDGARTTDFANTATSEANSIVYSLALVPGSDLVDIKDVPHGAVSQVFYQTKTLGPRRMHVYTPPGYAAGDEKFPVLYLLHGATDCDGSWTTVGRVGFMLNNLIAAGKAKPMIVVMPNGHQGRFTFEMLDQLHSQIDAFVDEFTRDVRPYVESHYRTLPGREHRALAGLSMGGAQVLHVAAAQPHDFGYLGVFSSGIFGIDKPAAEQTGPSWESTHRQFLDDAEFKRGLKLFWMGIGKQDFLLNMSRETVKMLRQHDFKIDYQETEGGHTWLVWRKYFADFAPQLFQSSP